MANKSITIEIQGLDKVFQAFKKAPAIITPHLRIASEKSAFLVEREAKIRTPVDTGRLRNSIATSLGIGGIRAIVQTNVNYAIFVHEGTRRMRARPFMREAVKLSTSSIQDIFNAEVELALAEITR